jgi:hypothetical protein
VSLSSHESFRPVSHRPAQGFVEITIKDLENLLHAEVSRLWSKGLLSVFADSKAKFDSDTNVITKYGRHLKVDDLILRRMDENGKPSNRRYTWKVVDLVYSHPLGLDDLQVDQEYGVFIRHENAVLPFKLVQVCLESKMYTFQALRAGVRGLRANARNLPSIYEKGTRRHAGVRAVIIECAKKDNNGNHLLDEMLMEEIEDEKFTLDVGHCHVIEAIGKFLYVLDG